MTTTMRDTLLGLAAAAAVFFVLRARQARQAADEAEDRPTMPRALNVAVAADDAAALPTAAVPATGQTLQDILDGLPSFDDLGLSRPRPTNTEGAEVAQPIVPPAPAMANLPSGPLVPEPATATPTYSTPTPAQGQTGTSPTIDPTPGPTPVPLPVPPTRPGAPAKGPKPAKPATGAARPGGLAPKPPSKATAAAKAALAGFRGTKDGKGV